MAAEFDEHILSTMTDEERATILEQQSPEEIAAIAAIANGDEDGPDDDEDDDVGDEGDAEDAAPAAPVAKLGEEAATPAAEADAAPVEQIASETFKPSYKAQLPADFEAQVAAVKEKQDALAEQFKGGEIDFDQYRVETEALSKSSRALDELSFKASLSQEMASQSVEQQWNFTVDAFIKATAKADGLDYSKDPEKNADLDLFVKSLAKDPKNADKPGEWFLAEGHKRVKALHGIVAAAPSVADAKASRKPPLAAAPKTLAQVPGGDGPGDVDGNEFSDVDRLTGDAQEAAIAKMSSDQRERYMAGV